MPPAHNMVSSARGLPETFRLGPIDPETSEMDLAKSEHLKWVLKLGLDCYDLTD